MVCYFVCWGKYKILGIFFGWRVLSDKCNKSCKLLKFACNFNLIIFDQDCFFLAVEIYM